MLYSLNRQTCLLHKHLGQANAYRLVVPRLPKKRAKVLNHFLEVFKSGLKDVPVAYKMYQHLKTTVDFYTMNQVPKNLFPYPLYPIVR